MTHIKFRGVPSTPFLGVGTPSGPLPTGPSTQGGQIVPLRRDLVIFDDFVHTSISTTVNTSQWHHALTAGHSIAIGPAHSAYGGTGYLLMNIDGTENSEGYLASNDNLFTPDTTRKIYFEARLEVVTVTSAEVVFGLFEADGSGQLAVGDLCATARAERHCGFYFNNSAVPTFSVGNSSSSATLTTGHTVVGGDQTTFAFMYSPEDGAWTTWIDGVEIFSDNTTFADVFPGETAGDQPLGLYFGVRNGAAASSDLAIDYVYLHAEA